MVHKLAIAALFCYAQVAAYTTSCAEQLHLCEDDKGSSSLCCFIFPHFFLKSSPTTRKSLLLVDPSPSFPPKPPLVVQAPPVLPIWSNWYFWLLAALSVLTGIAGCGYWRRRKIYESSASQTLGHVPFVTPTPSDDTPMYGPPLPFLPPVPFASPPSYNEAVRPSFDGLNQTVLDAMSSGRSVYDFYDRRHPNAFYDRYFLPDDTSSSETTSLLSYRLHRSCSVHLPRPQSLRRCAAELPPPAYSEVTAKPELYPVVVLRGGLTASLLSSPKSSKSATETPHGLHPWMSPYHYHIRRSGSLSTPEGSQSSSMTGSLTVQGMCDWWSGLKGRISPAVFFPSVSQLPSPGSSSMGPLPSDVSSLPPTSPPSPPSPTSPTFQGAAEFREVINKINQLPRSCSPHSLDGLDSEIHSPGSMLSPVELTPGHSPFPSEGKLNFGCSSSRPNHSCGQKCNLVVSYSLGNGSCTTRPKSLPIEIEYKDQNFLSSSTPNLLSEVDVHNKLPPPTRKDESYHFKNEGNKWWYRQSSVHHV